MYYSLEEALAIAFPSTKHIEKKSFILNDSQITTAEKLAQRKIESKLFTFYHGVKNGKTLGFAAIETQIVRTHPETLLIVLNPSGEVRKTVVLAFHEPPEYLPPEKWLAQFEGKDLSYKLLPGQDIQGIFGSTLSARSSSSAVRKVLALHKVLIEDTDAS